MFVFYSLESCIHQIESQFFFMNIKDEDFISHCEQQLLNNISPSLEGKTNVANMTDWKFFLKDDRFNDFLQNQFFVLVDKHSKFFGHGPAGSDVSVGDAWGVKLTKGQETKPHDHKGYNYASVMFFGEGTPLCTPERQFMPARGKIITFPGYIVHWVPPIQEEQRLSLAWNWTNAPKWN